MATYTICSRLVRACIKDRRHLVNILYRFVQEEPLRIAVDDNDPSKVLSQYASIDGDEHFIAEWLSFLAMRGDDALDIIAVNVEETTGEGLFVLVCQNTAVERNLLVDSKQHYKNFDLNALGIQLFDKSEACR